MNSMEKQLGYIKTMVNAVREASIWIHYNYWTQEPRNHCQTTAALSRILPSFACGISGRPQQSEYRPWLQIQGTLLVPQVNNVTKIKIQIFKSTMLIIPEQIDPHECNKYDALEVN